MGLTADVTGGAADGGVDIVAYDDSPITGGKYVIQCKRYGQSKKVGVGEVRELYGVVQAEGANKGILITSSSFTSHAVAFAEGKPIELINGTKLGQLLESTPAPEGRIEEVPHEKGPASAGMESASPYIAFGAAAGTAGSDRAALVALYNATDGVNWSNNSGWTSDAPLGEWHGVFAYDSRVHGLLLSDNLLSGQIPPELGNLTNLESLWLDGNQLDGQIPPELGRLTNLDWLNLGKNRLSGQIPPELGRLANLEVLNLSNNRLSGQIPPELGNLTNLESLCLYENQLDGEFPVGLGRLDNIELLLIGGNRFTGCIPEGLRDVSQNDLSELGLLFCDSPKMASSSMTTLAPTRTILTSTQPPDEPGLYAGVKSHSVRSLGGQSQLIIRGDVINHYEHAVFQPEVTIAVRDKDGGDTVVQADTQLPYLVLPAGSSAPFEIYFYAGETPVNWEIEVIMVEEGEGRERYQLGNDLDLCLYDDLTLKLIDTSVGYDITSFRFTISNLGAETPEFIQMLLYTKDPEGVFVGPILSSYISAKEHGSIAPGQTGTFETDDLSTSLVYKMFLDPVYMKFVVSNEVPERLPATLHVSYVAYLPGYAHFTHTQHLPDGEMLYLFDSNYTITRIS